MRHALAPLPDHTVPSMVHPEPLSPALAAVHRLAFYPVLVLQGLFIKMRTVRLQEPKGAREGVMGEGDDLRLLIIGDSSAAGVGVASQSQALSGRLAFGFAPYVRLVGNSWRAVVIPRQWRSDDCVRRPRGGPISLWSRWA